MSDSIAEAATAQRGAVHRVVSEVVVVGEDEVEVEGEDEEQETKYLLPTTYLPRYAALVGGAGQQK